MVLGIPFRSRTPPATCDLIQVVIGSTLPEDTMLAEQAKRLKMAVALATSNPSGKDFSLQCKELLDAESVGIFAVAHNKSQLRSCAPLALVATSESEPQHPANSGVSQLRTEALLHCVGANDGATTLVACAGKCRCMHAVADVEGNVIGVIEVARSAAAGGLNADEQLLLRLVAPAAATGARNSALPLSARPLSATHHRSPTLSARSAPLPDAAVAVDPAVCSTAEQV